jgi:hypothetical protein
MRHSARRPVWPGLPAGACCVLLAGCPPKLPPSELQQVLRLAVPDTLVVDLACTEGQVWLVTSDGVQASGLLLPGDGASWTGTDDAASWLVVSQDGPRLLRVGQPHARANNVPSATSEAYVSPGAEFVIAKSHAPAPIAVVTNPRAADARIDELPYKAIELTDVAWFGSDSGVLGFQDRLVIVKLGPSGELVSSEVASGAHYLASSAVQPVVWGLKLDADGTGAELTRVSGIGPNEASMVSIPSASAVVDMKALEVPLVLLVDGQVIGLPGGWTSSVAQVRTGQTAEHLCAAENGSELFVAVLLVDSSGRREVVGSIVRY